MKFEAFDEAMRVLPGVTLDIKWETRRTYCVGDRIFVLAGSLGEEEPCYVFKASDFGFEMLVETGVAAPAPYLGRFKWVTMTAPDALEDADLLAYVKQAYELVAAKLPKRVRLGFGILK